MASRTMTLILAGDAKKMSRTMRRASGSVDTFGSKVNRIAKVAAKAMGGLALAGAAAAAGLVADLVRTGDQFDKMSKRTGVSVEQLQRLKFAAEQSGSGIEAVEKGLKRSAKFLADAERGLSTYTGQMDELGLSVQDFQGLSPDEAFLKFSDAIGGLEDPIKRAALAQEVFGRAGNQLLPLMLEGSEGVKLLGDQMAATGNIISTEAAANAAEFNDTLNELKQVGLGAARDGLVQLLPALTKVARWVGDELIPAVKTMAENWRKFMPLVAGVGAALTALIALKVALFLKGIVVAIRAVNVAMLTGPGAIVVAVGLLVAGLVLAYQKSETFRTVVKAVFAAVKQAVALAVQVILGYVDLWLAGIEKIVGAADWLASKFGIDMGGVVDAVGSARDFIASAEQKIVDSLTGVGDSAEAAAAVTATAGDAISRAWVVTRDNVAAVSDDITEKVIVSAEDQRRALESHIRGMDTLRNAHAAARLSRKQRLEDAVFRIDANAARAQYLIARDGLSAAQRFLLQHKQASVDTHTAIAETAESSSTRVQSASERLAAGLVVTMTNACGTITGFKQCVDGMEVAFDANMDRVTSRAEDLASGLAVPITNACGTITGFKQCVDGMEVAFDANMQLIVDSADEMADGVGAAAEEAAGAVGALGGFEQFGAGQLQEAEERVALLRVLRVGGAAR